MHFKYWFFLFIISTFLFIPFTLQARYFARWHTTMGDFTAELRDELAPITANNFINLAYDHFYDGLRFHRIIHDFVIQDGDPLGTGFGGPGYTIADEFNVGLHHDVPGILAMANTGQPHSGGSQYYITLTPRPSLDGHYSIFGKVIQGMDIVQAIGAVPADTLGHPYTQVYINTLEILGLVINSVSPADSVVTYDIQNPYPFIMEAYDLITNANFQWFEDDILQPETDFLYTPHFTSTGEHTIKCITSDETVSWAFTWHVSLTGTANEDTVTPNSNFIVSKNYPNPFRLMTAFTYHSKMNDLLQINVYDIRGRLITHEDTFSHKQGGNQWIWEAKDAAPGVYLFEFKRATESKVVKGILIK
jgi:cyclophilin family peptidyl-prolyl cis-trans isomerase